MSNTITDDFLLNEDNLDNALSSASWNLPPSGGTIGSTVYTITNTGTASNSWWNNSSISRLGNSSKLSLNGEDADIEINGQSLVKMLQRIEERINILTVNPELETEWEELRQLGDQYRALEYRIKEKMETWNKIKARDKDNR